MNRQQLLETCFPEELYTPLSRQFEVTRGTDVLAHVETGFREVTMNDYPWSLGQVGWVCVDPDFRGEGLATALLDSAHELLFRTAEYVALFTGVPEFFKRFGYERAYNLGSHALVLCRDTRWNPGARVKLNGDKW